MDGFCPMNFPKSTKTQCNKHVRDLLFFRIFSCVFTRNSPLGLGCKFVCTSVASNLKRVPGGIVFGEFNQIEPCTFKNLTIFNAFSYLRLGC